MFVTRWWFEGFLEWSNSTDILKMGWSLKLPTSFWRSLFNCNSVGWSPSHLESENSIFGKSSCEKPFNKNHLIIGFCYKTYSLIASQGLFELEMEPCDFELQPLCTPGKLNEKNKKKNTPQKNLLRNSELVGSLEVFDYVFRVKLLVLGGFIDVLLLTLTCEAWFNLTKIILHCTFNWVETKPPVAYSLILIFQRPHVWLLFMFCLDVGPTEWR